MAKLVQGSKIARQVAKGQEDIKGDCLTKAVFAYIFSHHVRPQVVGLYIYIYIYMQ